ncbi:MAG: hypothetical protein HY037_00695 [Nitrospirae bacterium]|nr:hypothetical protein [Candidatus Troglogloeales bacterium]
MRFLFFLLFYTFLIFSSAPVFSQPIDIESPQINPIRLNDIAVGKEILVTATVTDNVEIKEVALYYKTIGASGYSKIMMSHKEGDLYTAIIPGAQLPGIIDYYFEATDTSDNVIQAGDPSFPLFVKVEAEITPPPPTPVQVPVMNPEVFVLDSAPSEIPPTLTSPIIDTKKPKAKQGISKWKWVVGVVVVAVIAALSSGKGGGDNTDGNTTITITGPSPP